MVRIEERRPSEELQLGHYELIPQLLIAVEIPLVRGTPRTEPDERSLAHPVLISDEWRRSGRQERGGALAVVEAMAEPKRGCASRRSGVSGSGGAGYATREQAPDPET